ncbi:MAG: hypothetical protein IPL65_04880 [Lewinellaceae bacterium]|nr:hypothetical protein [Lewinellaceae bacterium]
MQRLPLIALFIALIAASCSQHNAKSEHRPSHAGEAMRMWAMARTFPDGHFYTEKYTQAVEQVQLEAQLRGDRNNNWEAIGPKNIGGRTLCLAIHPIDTSLMVGRQCFRRHLENNHSRARRKCLGVRGNGLSSTRCICDRHHHPDSQCDVRRHW